MKSIVKCLLMVFGTIMLSSCMLLQPIVVKHVLPIENYKYFYVKPTQELQSGSGGAFPIGGVIYGISTTKSVNPSDVISGFLIKNGFILLPELAQQTLIVNYGESGKRYGFFTYITEVTIQFVSAYTNEVVAVCTAEGAGETEVDGIRIAINRALSGSFFEQ